ncbi:unnamed protein product [Prorocentrum cordatum]|nr:unnamed protein product [Polarella glacialis]
MARHGRPKGAGDLVGYVTPAEGTWADCFPTEDLGYVLSDFGYVTSVEAVYECLDKFDEVEEEDSLTIEELALFLREYRKALRERPDLAQQKMAWLQRHDKESGDLYGFLPIVEGMPVALTDHIDRSEDKNLLRGRVGRVQSWACDGDGDNDRVTRGGETILKKTPKVIFVLFDEGDGGKGGRKPCQWTIEGMKTPGLHPVIPQKKEWFVDKGRPHPRLKVKRRQFPLAPAFGVTAHAAQGQTFKQGVIVDLSIGGGTSGIEAFIEDNFQFGLNFDEACDRAGIPVFDPEGAVDAAKLQCRRRACSTKEPEDIAKALLYTEGQPVIAGAKIPNFEDYQQECTSRPNRVTIKVWITMAEALDTITDTLRISQKCAEVHEIEEGAVQEIEEGAEVQEIDEGAEVQEIEEQGAEVQEIDEQGAEVQESGGEVQEIDEQGAEVDQEIEEQGAEVDQEIEEQGAEVQEIDGQGAEVDQGIEEQSAELPDGMQNSKRRGAEKISTIVFRATAATNGWPQFIQCADKTWGESDNAKELSETCMKDYVMQMIIEKPTVTKAVVSSYRNSVVNELRSSSGS